MAPPRGLGGAASLQYQGPPLLVCGDHLHGDKDRLEAEESRLHPDVLWLATPVHKEPLGAAYLLPSGIANRIPRVFFRGPDRASDLFTTYRCVRCAHGRIPFFGPLAVLWKTLSAA